MKITLIKNVIQSGNFKVIIDKIEGLNTSCFYLSMAGFRCQYFLEGASISSDKISPVQMGMAFLLKEMYQSEMSDNASFDVDDAVLSDIGANIKTINSYLSCIQSFNKEYLHKRLFIDFNRPV